MLSKGIRQQQHVLRPPLSAIRWPHKVPLLTHNERFRKDGIPDTLSADGFDIAWTQYQTYLVRELNRRIPDPDKHSKVKDILLKYARQAEQAPLFNYASMAHNNHFFFNSISPTSTSVPPRLLDYMNASFSSVESLRATFLATANAMFGPGFVWLVRKKNATPGDELAILTTYLAGSPYPGAHFRLQPNDMNTQTTNISDQSPTEYAAANQYHLRPHGRAGAFGSSSESHSPLAPGGQDLTPILVVSTWEHVWLRDWGVGGKNNFLSAWWEKIDWGLVEVNLGQDTVGSSPRVPQYRRTPLYSQSRS